MGQSGAQALAKHQYINLIKSYVFIGEFHHNIDEKGRLQVPAKWRSSLAEGAVVTKGFDGSLAFYSADEWKEKAEKLSKLPQSQPEARAFVRQTLAGAVDVELDKLGRVVLPQFLKQYASLSKEAVLAGLYDHFEIWSSSNWEKYQESVDANSKESVQVLKDLGV